MLEVKDQVDKWKGWAHMPLIPARPLPCFRISWHPATDSSIQPALLPPELSNWAPCCSGAQLLSWSLVGTVHRGRAWGTGKLRSRMLLPRKRWRQGKMPVGLADGQPSFEADLQDSKSCPSPGRLSQHLPGIPVSLCSHGTWPTRSLHSHHGKSCPPLLWKSLALMKLLFFVKSDLEKTQDGNSAFSWE